MITLAILSLLTLTIATAFVIARRRQRSARRRDDIPLFTVSAPSLVPAARPMVDLGDTPPSFDSVPPSRPHEDSVDAGLRFSPAAATIRTRDGAVSTLARPQRGDPPAPPADEHGENSGEAAAGQMWLADAPVSVVACADPARSRGRYGDRAARYALIDTSFACMLLLLEVTERDLGACFVGAFDDARVRSLLELPPDVQPLAVIPIGHPAETPKALERRPAASVIHSERWTR